MDQMREALAKANIKIPTRKERIRKEVEEVWLKPPVEEPVKRNGNYILRKGGTK